MLFYWVITWKLLFIGGVDFWVGGRGIKFGGGSLLGGIFLGEEEGEMRKCLAGEGDSDYLSRPPSRENPAASTIKIPRQLNS